jgi:hypothetical protein
VGLQAIALPMHVLVRGITEEGPTRPAFVAERDVGGGRRARVIVTPPTGGCGYPPADTFQFASGNGRVFLIERGVRSDRISVTACGCPTCRCPTPTLTPCGGIRIRADTILGYELPPGMEFGGRREIAYATDWIAVDQVLPPQPVCKPPPPQP